MKIQDQSVCDGGNSKNVKKRNMKAAENIRSKETDSLTNRMLVERNSAKTFGEDAQMSEFENVSVSASQANANEGDINKGRWEKDEHIRFLKALKQHKKEWKKVQEVVGTRTSTQARSHAQKFFQKLKKKGETLDDFLLRLNLDMMSGLEQDDPQASEN